MLRVTAPPSGSRSRILAINDMPWFAEEVWRHRQLTNLPSAAAGDIALRVFCAPNISERRPPNHRQLVERARYHLRHARIQRIATPVGDIATYTLEPDRQPIAGTVLVVHGWTSEASSMTAIAEPIRRAGFRVVLIDLPAHGRSDGRSTQLVDCARAVAFIGEALGPLHAVVTHSFGGLIALVAAEGLAPVPTRLIAKHAVLIASPNRLLDFTRDFCEHWHVSPAGRRAFENRLSRVGHRPLEYFTASKMLGAIDGGGFIIHDRNDTSVAFRCAEEIVEATSAKLLATQGLGHNNILFASQVTRAVANHLSGTV